MIKPSVGTIEEGRKVSFRSPSPSKQQGTVPFPESPKPMAQDKGKEAETTPERQERAKALGVVDDGSGSIVIGKASAVVDEVRVGPSRDDEWRDRLDKLDARQERIERLLSRLVGDGEADVFSATKG
jgi:hypothetical protein